MGLVKSSPEITAAIPTITKSSPGLPNGDFRCRHPVFLVIFVHYYDMRSYPMQLNNSG
jgi:hypothetical protein